MNVALYSIVYNGSYLLPEAVITVVILLIPPVNKALQHVKQIAESSWYQFLHKNKNGLELDKITLSVYSIVSPFMDGTNYDHQAQEVRVQSAKRIGHDSYAGYFVSSGY